MLKPLREVASGLSPGCFVVACGRIFYGRIIRSLSAYRSIRQGSRPFGGAQGTAKVRDKGRGNGLTGVGGWVCRPDWASNPP